MQIDVAKAVAQYQRRLLANRECARRHYLNKAIHVKRRKLMCGVAQGRCPSDSTIDRLEVNREALMHAWEAYLNTNPEIGKRAQAFHRRLTGTELAFG
jgi:hypothetical protein